MAVFTRNLFTTLSNFDCYCYCYCYCSNGAVPSKSETANWVGPGNQHISPCSKWPQKRTFVQFVHTKLHTTCQLVLTHLCFNCKLTVSLADCLVGSFSNQHISRCSNWPQKRKMNICSNCAHKIAHYMSICFDTSLL